MINTFSTKYNKQFGIDLSKWIINPNDIFCKIIYVYEEELLLLNIFNDQFKIPKTVFEVNELSFDKEKIELSKELYIYWFLDRFNTVNNRVLKNLHKKKSRFIFQNGNIVLSKSECYLLTLSYSSTGQNYIGVTNFCLGQLFESGHHIYYDELYSFQKKYLTSINITQLSGKLNKAIFWSNKTIRFIGFNEISNLQNHVVNL